MSDYFAERQIEFQATVAKQAAERRKKAQAEGAKVKAESDKVYEALVDTFPQPEKPVAPERPFLDMVRDAGSGITPQERQRLRSEEYRARRAARVEAEMKLHQRGQENDELGANRFVNPPEIDWSEIDNDDSDEYLED